MPNKINSYKTHCYRPVAPRSLEVDNSSPLDNPDYWTVIEKEEFPALDGEEDAAFDDEE
jgi:hypothetical protein